MARVMDTHGKASWRNRTRLGRRHTPQRFADWVNGVRNRLLPTVYVDSADVPDTPPSPYRARIMPRPEERPEEPEVGEREVVRGQMRTVYEVRCLCGKRWFNPQFESIQLCPRCGCVVLLERDGSPA